VPNLAGQRAAAAAAKAAARHTAAAAEPPLLRPLLLLLLLLLLLAEARMVLWLIPLEYQGPHKFPPPASQAHSLLLLLGCLQPQLL
jgi:hypothetical protein